MSWKTTQTTYGQRNPVNTQKSQFSLALLPSLSVAETQEPPRCKKAFWILVVENVTMDSGLKLIGHTL